MANRNKSAGASGGRVNKMDLVRQAIKDLGGEATPKDLQDFLRDRFDVEMDKRVLSSYKTLILKKAAGQSSVIQQPVIQKPAVEPTSSAPTAVRKEEPINGGISVEDIRDVKELADRLGPNKLRALVDVLYQ